MHILSIRPEPPGFGSVIARFDMQLTPDVRMFNLKLVEKPDGRRMTYSPQSGGERTATFTRELAEEITRAAGVALEGMMNDRSRTAS